MNLDKLIEDYQTNNGVYFELSMKDSEGNTLAKFTSHIDATDVAANADNLNEQLMNLAIEASIEKADYLVESQAEAFMQQVMDERVNA